MSIRKYLKECQEVYHTTLDPNGPGAIRIHLVPPRRLKPGIPWVVIINGYSILPLQTSWAILLKEFIVALNESKGESLDEEDINSLVGHVIKRVKDIYKDAKDEDIKEDLNSIIDVLLAISKNEEPKLKIGLLSLGEYAKDLRAPHRMDLMISSMTKNKCWHCNQKCLLCYAGDERLANVEELSTEEWLKIIDIMKESYIPELTFTGGEPTLREDLPILVEHAKWFVTRLNTNGIRLTKDLCKRLYEASLDSVQVTLYSYDEAIHNKMVGGNHFRETIAGIKNALEAGLDVSINTPLCNLNKDYLHTVMFAHKLGIRYFSSSGVIPTGYALEKNEGVEALSKEEILACIKEAYSYTSVNNLELAFTSPGWIDSKELDLMHMVTPSCGACLSNMAIAPNGEVIPCQSWLFEDGLGNILTTKFKRIWSSKKCKKRRAYSAKSLEKCALREVR